MLAGCISAGWQGPVFVQGDHYQFNAKKYAADPDGVAETLRKATLDALAVGYGNIDIDSSTLVDLAFPTVDEQQTVNYQRAGELAAVIRSRPGGRPDGRPSAARSARSASRTPTSRSCAPTWMASAGSSTARAARACPVCPR